MKRILIVKMWALGDILMATPLLRAIKSQWPECEIDWFVEKAQAPVLKDNPLIHEVIAFDSASWRRQFRYGKLISYWKTSTAMRRMLQARRYDAVINLTAEKWWSVWFAVAPVRVGLFPRERAGLIGRVYTHVIERARSPWLHNTQHYLLTAGALGIPKPWSEEMVLGVSDRDRAESRDFLQSRAVFQAGRPTVILHPGTSQKSKCWLPEHYARLADLLTGHNVVLTGSPGEQALCREIAQLSKRSDLIIAAGALRQLGQTAALVEQSAAVVTGDTSLLHMASALNVPLVGIYGSTRPRDNAPLFGRCELLFDDTVPCAPCYKAKCPLAGEQRMRCMRQVMPEQVVDALVRLGVDLRRGGEPIIQHADGADMCVG